MAENVERIARRALMELDTNDARRLARIAQWEAEEEFRTATRH
jgi:hypothetical protein